MIRIFTSYLLALSLMLASLSLAYARGSQPELGSRVDVVICTGMGLKTVTFGADGRPFQSYHLCPDGAQMFGAVFHVPELIFEARGIGGSILPEGTTAQAAHADIIAQARAPPAGA